MMVSVCAWLMREGRRAPPGLTSALREQIVRDGSFDINLRNFRVVRMRDRDISHHVESHFQWQCSDARGGCEKMDRSSTPTGSFIALNLADPNLREFALHKYQVLIGSDPTNDFVNR